MEQMPLAEPNGLPDCDSGCLPASYFATPGIDATLEQSPVGPRCSPNRVRDAAAVMHIGPLDSQTEDFSSATADGSELCDDEGALRVRRSAMN